VVEVPELEAVVILVPEIAIVDEALLYTINSKKKFNVCNIPIKHISKCYIRGTQVMIILFKIRSVYLFTF
jgi:hypothetical protein